MNAVKRMWAVLAGLGGLAASARGAELAWVELATSGAPASAATFYEKTFGWTAERLGEGDWDPVVLRRGDRVIAGVAHRQGERLAKARTRWLGFFAAEDAAAVEKRAEEAGGRVIEEAHRGAAVGAKQVLLADGEGAVFGLVSGLADGTKGGRGVWPVALANDTPAAAKFYHTVLGGEVRDEKRTPMFRGDFLLMEGAQAWAGVQPASVGGRAGWIFLIGVADIDATVKAARKEGAKVWREPVVDLIGGRVAVLSDPMGGVFGLYETLPVAPTKATGGAKVSFEVEAISK